MAEGTLEQVLACEAAWHLAHADALAWMPTLPENSIDCAVVDAPYELGFMGRKWDRSGIAFSPDVWSALLRVLKPGAHLLAFGGTRTMHRIACAIEDAGFEIRDYLEWVYGSGFPKSMNLGEGRGTALKPAHEPIYLCRKPLDGTLAANLAKWGTGALNIDACRVGTDKRVPGSPKTVPASSHTVSMPGFSGGSGHDPDVGRWPPNLLLGHSPGCVCLGTRKVKGHPSWDTPNRECKPVFTGETVSRVQHGDGVTEEVAEWRCVEGCPVLEMGRQSGHLVSGHMEPTLRSNRNGYSGPMPALAPGHAGDSGTAARYFPQFQHDPELDDLTRFYYCAKASRGERDAGLDWFRARSAAEATDSEEGQARLDSPRTGAGRTGGARNVHPTVKPGDLIRWLVRLGCPPRGVVIDWATGSGTTGMAAVAEGRRFVGCELMDTDEEPHASIARARIAYVEGRVVVPRESLRGEPPKQGALFDG